MPAGCSPVEGTWRQQLELLHELDEVRVGDLVVRSGYDEVVLNQLRNVGDRDAPMSSTPVKVPTIDSLLSCKNQAMKFDVPRSLSDAERLVLEALLAPQFPGVAELRAQLVHVQVVGKCGCGCPTVDLFVPLNAVPSPLKTSNRLAPVEGRVMPIADEPPGEIILFVDDGRLSCLEYVSYDEPSPAEWPSLDRITVVRTG